MLTPRSMGNKACQFLLVLAIFYPHMALTKEKNIILVGNPRGITTAFERYMIKRGDYEIHHEPVSVNAWFDALGISFYSYLSGDNVLLSIHEKKRDKPYFIKEMAFFLNDDQDFRQLMQADDVEIVFLIRAPEKPVLSHYKLTRDSNMGHLFGGTREEMKYSMMEELFFKVMQAKNKTPILIDADDLLADPKKVLSKFCTMLDIPFKEQDLKWEGGENTHWRMGSHAWHHQVTDSQGFSTTTTPHNLEEVDPEHVEYIQGLIRKNKKIYSRLVEYKISG